MGYVDECIVDMNKATVGDVFFSEDKYIRIEKDLYDNIDHCEKACYFYSSYGCMQAKRDGRRPYCRASNRRDGKNVFFVVDRRIG